MSTLWNWNPLNTAPTDYSEALNATSEETLSKLLLGRTVQLPPKTELLMKDGSKHYVGACITGETVCSSPSSSCLLVFITENSNIYEDKQLFLWERVTQIARIVSFLEVDGG